MNPRITYSGQEAMLKALNGDEIHFTKIKIGNGQKPTDYRQLTDLQNPLKTLSIEQAVVEDHYAKLTGETVTNADFESDFYWTEIGIFVSDPDGGQDDLLYAYAHYELSEDSSPLYIGASTSSVVQLTPVVHVYIGDAENITAEISEASDYALKTELQAHTADETNPHNVTKAQVGLGSVPNVSTNDQTPTFSAASTLAEINSGEKMSVIMGKIKKAIRSLIGHISDNHNPHEVTPLQINAAPKIHSHNASDINAGTLGISRGGTGASTGRGVAQFLRDYLAYEYSYKTVTLARSDGTVLKNGQARLYEIGPIKELRIEINAIDVTYSTGEALYINGLGDYVSGVTTLPVFFSVRGSYETICVGADALSSGSVIISPPGNGGTLRSYIEASFMFLSNS